MLIEYSLDGSELNRYELHARTFSPFHALRLANRRFLDCHRGETHQICIVSDDRHVVYSFNGHPEGNEYLEHFTVDKHRFVHAADSSSKCVLPLSPSLSFIRVLLSAKDGLIKPSWLCLNENRNLRYIGELESKRGRVSRQTYVFKRTQTD